MRFMEINENFSVDTHNSDQQYCTIKIKDRGCVQIKNDEEGVVVDIFNESGDSEPASSTYAFENELAHPNPNNEENVKLLLDDNRGVYIPRDFAEEFDHSQFTGYTQDDVDELIHIGNTNWEDLEIDDSQIYFDIWDRILQNAEHYDNNGRKWVLHQDGPLWLVCPELMSEEDQDAFFG